MPRHSRKPHLLSRRALLKGLACTPVLLRASPLYGGSLLFGSRALFADVPQRRSDVPLAFSDIRLTPRYPKKSPLDDILRLVPPGSDEFATEKYAADIQSLLDQWSAALKINIPGSPILEKLLDPSMQGANLTPASETTVRTGTGIEVLKRKFPQGLVSGQKAFLDQLHGWLKDLSRIDVAEFEITSIDQTASTPLTVSLTIRYDIVGDRPGKREERVGSWRTEWTRNQQGWKATKWETGEETVSRATGPAFVDVTQRALGATASYRDQLLHGSDYWRTVLDGACGIDVYGNNGVVGRRYQQRRLR